jgi:UDP-glucose 4-epimerase
VRVLIVGGAGFIGSHFVDRLLADPEAEQVTVFDDFSVGSMSRLRHHDGDNRLHVIAGDARWLGDLRFRIRGHDLVIHLASNADIAASTSDPTVDFGRGTLITQNVLEAMREADVPRIIYASGSGVYGDRGSDEACEDDMTWPLSTYAASKLAGEALIGAYAHMFDIQGSIFRFANVVGPRQTHGVGFDFVRRLREDPTRLDVLGDGSQSKSYVLVTDVVEAALMASRLTQGVEIYNVATGDYVTVREIADIAIRASGLNPKDVAVNYGSGPRGWMGDIPVVRLNCDRIRALGWQPTMGSAQALEHSIAAMLAELA